MNTPLDEVRRLRGELDAKQQELTALRGLVREHLEATGYDPELALKMEQAAFERGREIGDQEGWRRGVEHALMEVDRAHWRGDAHTPHGEMRELGLHDGPVPARKTPDEIVAQADKDEQLRAEWWAREYERTHPQAEVRQIRPKERGEEREAS